MKIRPLIESDRPAAQAILHSTGIFAAEEERVALELIDTYLSQADESRDYEVAMIEDNAGTAAGFVCYGATPLTEGTFDLYWLAVHANHQRQGVGKALINWVEEKAAERKTRLILIETSSNAKYASARRFYERMRYAETARIRDFYRPGDDRIIFSKYLRLDKAQNGAG